MLPRQWCLLLLKGVKGVASISQRGQVVHRCRGLRQRLDNFEVPELYPPHPTCPDVSIHPEYVCSVWSGFAALGIVKVVEFRATEWNVNDEDIETSGKVLENELSECYAQGSEKKCATIVQVCIIPED